jgi:hypothetical protein
MTKKKTTKEPAIAPKKDQRTSAEKTTTTAHDQAEKDIEEDPDLNTKPHREDDLDEGELARLEGED